MAHDAPPPVRWPNDQILAQLDRVLASETFRRSQRMSRFLRYIVEKSLQGEGDLLKEYRLGVDVFDREPSYDPRLDPVVRTEARRLRSKLETYYTTAGSNDPIRIVLPKGSYWPEFAPAPDMSAKVEPAERVRKLPLKWIWGAVALSAIVAGALFWGAKRSQRVEISSLAVLPMTSFSSDPEHDRLADALTDAITSALARVHGLHVAARTSAFQFKGRGQDIRDIGRRLNVGTILEGSLHPAGDRLRITLQLVRASDGFHVWSEVYERARNDATGLPEEVALAVSNVLGVHLGGEQRRAARYRQNREVYNLYLQGRYLWNFRSLESIHSAIALFHQAAGKDPRYALAYAGLADCYGVLAANDQAPPNEVAPKAKEMALKALEIDPELAEAHATLGLLKTFYEWDWSGAEQEYLRALELDPAYASARQGYAMYLSVRGRATEAIREAKRAAELDPLSYAVGRSVAMAYYYGHEYDETIRECRRLLETQPRVPGASDWLHRFIAAVYRLQGRMADAAAERQLISASFQILAAPEAESEQARERIPKLIEESKRRYIAPLIIASAYYNARDLEQGFAWVRKAYEQHDCGLVWLNVQEVPPEQADPRIGALMRQIGLRE